MKTIPSLLISKVFPIGLVALLLFFSSACSKEGKAAKLIANGERYLADYKYEEARIVFMNALRAQPTNAVALARLGAIAREDGNLLRAFQLLKRAREVAPRDPLVAIESGEIYLQIGDRLMARSNALELLKMSQMSDRAARLLARSSITKPELDQARSLIEPLLQANPASRTLNEAWGHWLLRQNQLPDAIKSFQKVVDLDAKAEEAYLTLAALYRAQNNPQEARQLLEACLRHIPPASRAGLMLVDLLLKSGSIEEGKKLLRQIVDRRSDFVSAWVYQADIDLAEKNYSDAAKRAQHVLSLDPSNYTAQAIQGRIAITEGRWQDAIERLQQLAKMYPKAAEPHYQLAIAQLLKGEAALALRSLDTTLQMETNHIPALMMRAQLHLRTGAVPQAVQAMSEQIKSHPNHFQAYQILAQAYLATNDWSRALDTYQKAAEVFPKNPEPIFLSGMVRLQQKLTNEASLLFEKTLHLATNYTAALVQLANIDVQKKDFPGAIQRVRSYLTGRTNAELLVLLARLENMNGNSKEAEAVLQRAVEIDDEKGLATQELVKLYLARTNEVAALQAIQKGLAEKPDNLPLLTRAALLYDRTKQFQTAIQHYERILGKTTNSPLALNNLAWLYCEELNQREKAFELGKRARQANPNDPYVADTFGWILYRRGDYQWALSLLQESAQKLTDNSDVHAHLGLTHYMLGEETPALSALERAISFSDDFREKTNALAALAILKLDARQPDAASLKLLNQRLAESPNDPVALAKLGQAHAAKGDFESARIAYQKLLQVHPTSPAALLSLARLEFYQFRDRSKALEYLQNISFDQMQSPSIAGAAGRLLLDAGETRRAYDILSVTSRDPAATPDTALAAGFAALRTGRLSEAEAGFRRASAAKDTNPGRKAEIFLGLLQSYQNRKQAKVDEGILYQVLQNDPGNELAKLLQGVALVQSGKWQNAQAAFQEILKAYPGSALAAKHLAMVEATYAKNYDSALALASNASETIENDSELLALLAQLHYRKTNYSRVITLASESLRTDPNNPDTIYYLGLAQYQTGDKRNGTNTLKRALALAPKNPLSSQAQQLITTAK